MKALFLLWLVAPLAFFALQPRAAETTSVADPEPKDVAYLRTINERAAKIVATLGMATGDKSNRVQSIIVQQYRDLNDAHFVRDVRIGNAKREYAEDKAAANAAIQVVRDDTKPRLDKLHAEFLSRLSAELSPEQVDQVKDGLTYGVVPITYGVYLKMYPDLTQEQKQQIMSWLVEAREIAMIRARLTKSTPSSANTRARSTITSRRPVTMPRRPNKT